MPTVCDLEGTVKGGKWGRMRKGREKSRAMCVVFWIILLPRQRVVFTHFPKVVAAVLGEATFCRLCKSGLRLFGRRYKVDAFEEAWRPDAFCSRCSEWKHIAPLPGPQVCPLREGPPHDRPRVPRRGLQGGEEQPVSTRDGKVRKLRRISWGADRCLCCQEGGPFGRQGVEE